MKTLIMSSSFKGFTLDENGNKIPCKIDNENGFLDTLKKYLTKRRCMVIISGNPKKLHTKDPNDITRQYFALSGIPFDEYIYVSDVNKEHIAEYIAKADCINLFGGHLPTANTFVNELNLRELVKDFNGVLLGGSGGAMNMADTVYCKPEAEGEFADKSFKRYLRGLGLTNINIIPHYYLIKDKTLDGGRIIEDVIGPDTYKTPMIVLPDGSYIVQQGDNVEIFGEAYLFKDGKITQINENNNTRSL
jgi:dipeptidase E